VRSTSGVERTGTTAIYRGEWIVDLKVRRGHRLPSQLGSALEFGAGRPGAIARDRLLDPGSLMLKFAVDRICCAWLVCRSATKREPQRIMLGTASGMW